MFDKEKFYKEASEGFKEKKLNEGNKLSGKQKTENPERVGKTSFQKRREKRVQDRAERRAKRGGAAKNPEQFKTLIVRVAGYSAYFTELCKEVQDEIISRTTHQTM